MKHTRLVVLCVLIAMWVNIGDGNEYIMCNRKSEKALDSGVIAQRLAWCQTMMSTKPIQIGKSFGGMNKVQRDNWLVYDCPGLLTRGRPYSCSEKVGKGWVDLWRTKNFTVVEGDSEVTCFMATKANVVCRFENIVVDFGKIVQLVKRREFQPGFVSMFGRKNNVGSNDSIPIPPSIGGVGIFPSRTLAHECSETIHKPAFFMSHDDPWNLGHHLNDVFMVHSMLLLSGRSPNGSVFVNADGVRPGGPGGKGHRTFWAGPDQPGPFDTLYTDQFNGLKYTAAGFGKNKVCFKEAYFQPFPGTSHIWDMWSMEDPCAKQHSPSAVYQSLNLRLRLAFNARRNATLSLPTPPSDHIRVLLIVRGTAKGRLNNPKKAVGAKMRMFENEASIVSTLESIRGVRVVKIDFATISFEEQVRMIHSSSIMMGAHGAAMVHSVHMATGHANCCSVIEVMPPKRFSDIWGYGNVARSIGTYYDRILGTESPTGTLAVSNALILEKVAQAIADMTTKPSCMHPDSLSMLVPV